MGDLPQLPVYLTGTPIILSLMPITATLSYARVPRTSGFS